MQERAGRQDTRKIVTVLFCDLVGSTAMGEHLDPETTRAIISRYFEVVRTALERHGATVEKFIGDAVMAVFGIPTLHEDDALRAVRAAAEIQLALHALDRELQADHALGISIRIGIDTGVAAVGSGTRRPATRDGPRGQPCGSPRADRRTRRGPPRSGHLSARARGGRRRGARAGRPEGSGRPGRGLATPGRAVPMPRPSNAGRTSRSSAGPTSSPDSKPPSTTVVADRACALVTVVGPPGIGKSRLGVELATRLDGRADVVVGRCLPYGEGITYSALGEILAQVDRAASLPSSRSRVRTPRSSRAS